jgi:hypothetical protein
LSLSFEFGFALWRDCGEPDTTSLGIDVGHPSCDHVTDLNRFVQILDVAIGDSADVNQAAAFRRHFNERTELSDTHDDADDLFTDGQVGKLRHFRHDRMSVTGG